MNHMMHRIFIFPLLLLISSTLFAYENLDYKFYLGFSGQFEIYGDKFNLTASKVQDDSTRIKADNVEMQSGLGFSGDFGFVLSRGFFVGISINRVDLNYSPNYILSGQSSNINSSITSFLASIEKFSFFNNAESIGIYLGASLGLASVEFFSKISDIDDKVEFATLPNNLYFPSSAFKLGFLANPISTLYITAGPKINFLPEKNAIKVTAEKQLAMNVQSEEFIIDTLKYFVCGFEIGAKLLLG